MFKSIKSFITLFLSLLVMALCVGAMQGNAQVRPFTSENGLPQNSIKSMCADRNGFLWIATEDGLARFDGTSFIIYKRDNTPAFTANRIIQVGLLADGTVYCSNDSREIFIYTKEGTWVQVAKVAGWQWVLASDNSLYYLPPVLATKESAALRQELDRDKPGRQTYLPVEGNRKGFLIVNKKMLCYIADKKIKWYDILSAYNLHLNHAIGIYNSHVYYLDTALQLIRIDTNGKHQVVSEMIKEAGRTTSYNKGNLSLNEDGQDIFLQKDTGLYRLEEVNGAVRFVPELSLSGISNIFCYQRFGALGIRAVGSLTEGLYLFRSKPFQAHTISTDAANIFYAAVPMPDGGIFTHLGVIGGAHQLPATIGHIEPWSILRDRNVHYWIDIDGNEVAELDSSLQKIRTIRSKPTAAQCFRQTPDGKIWLSNTNREMGFIERDSIHWLPDLKLAGTTGIFTFLPLSDSLFLVGGQGDLFLLYPYTGRQQPLWHNRQRQVRYLYKDVKGIIWIGTYGDGLFAWDGKTIIPMRKDIMHGSNSVHALLEDRQGFFWLSSNNGLYQVKSNELRAAIYNPQLQPYFYYYDQSNGFLSNEFNGACNPSGSYLANGTMFFPSVHGMVSFMPDGIRPVLPSSGIFVDQIVADGRYTSGQDSLVFPANTEYVEVRVSAPFFGPRGNQQLQYQLADANDRWNPVPDGGRIIFNRLRHGSYRLMLRKQTGFGAQDFAYKELFFSVQPAFRETLLFRLLILIAAVSITIAFFRSRNNYLLRQQRKLQQEVEERTSDQQRLIAVLKESDRIKEKIMQVITHDMQSQLHFVSMLAGGLADNLEEEGRLPDVLTARNLKKATAELQRFTANFSVWTAAYIDGFQVRNTTFFMRHLAEDLQRFFGDVVSREHNTLIFDFPEELMLYTDRHLLQVILRNLIDNANKHTTNGSIKLQAIEEHTWITIRISDSGAGMSAAQLQDLSEIIAAAGNHETVFNDRQHRIGYRLIADFVVGIDAKIHIDSQPGNGTIVTIAQIKKGIEKPH